MPGDVRGIIEPVLGALRRRVGPGVGRWNPDRAEHMVLRWMHRCGDTDPRQFLHRIDCDSELLDQLVNELTVGETYFFREPQQFDFIAREVLPEICTRRGAAHVVRAWSAGCASGEEPYSLAMLCTRNGFAARLCLLATDISRIALAKARAACFGAWSLRGDMSAAAFPFLRRHGDQWLVEPAIQRLVTFQYLNLALDIYPSLATGAWSIDLLLCRNVLIYMPAEAVQEIARRLAQTLAPGGWLVTASSDPPLQHEPLLQPVVTSAGVFYRRPDVGFSSSRSALEFRIKVEGAGTRSENRVAAGTQPVSPLPKFEFEVPGPTEHADSPAHADPNPNPADDIRDPICDMVQRVRELANQEPAEAERVCAAALGRHPLSAELQYLHAVFLVALGREDEAIPALRRVIYLDRSLAVAHLTLGSLLQRRDDPAGAKRAYGLTRDLCFACPADEIAPLSYGESAGRLRGIAEMELAAIDAMAEVS